uniref:Patched family protein n=1 Tax=Loa loa TaxID=7209 RepID=A0A1I7VZ19_LOALO
MCIRVVEPRFRRFFQWYGEFGYQWRWFLVMYPLIVTPLLSLGFCRLTALNVDDPFYVFTPAYARWHREFDTFASLWPLNENKFLPGKSFEMKQFINVLVKAKDGGNLLRKEILDEIQELNQWVMFNISIPTADGKYNLTYQDLCLSYEWVCGANEHISMLQERLKVGNFVELTYPRAGSKDTPVYLGTLLSDVSLNDSNGTVKAAKLTQLFYFLKQEPHVVRRYSTAFSYAVEHYLLHIYKSDIISLSFSHYQSLQDGIAENAKDFTWNFLTSFSLLSIYAIIFSYVLKQHPRTGIDWVRSKPYVACAGLITTLLAICSGFGLALIVGIPYNVINTIIPFLIIAIGVDDMFVMNACWNQTSQTDTVSKRMRDMMAHAGVTISITNITDIISFAVGCISELPGIQLFCSYACITFIFCYLYQFTFFMAFLAIMGAVEKNQRHCLLFYKVGEQCAKKKMNSARFCNSRNDCDDSLQCSSTNSGSDISYHSGNSTQSNGSSLKTAIKIHNLIIAGDDLCKQKPTEMVDVDNNFITEGLFITAVPHLKTQPIGKKENTRTQYFFGHIYAQFILRKECAILTYIFYSIYIGGAMVGCFNFSEGLEPENLVTNDHYTSHYFADLKNFWVRGTQLHVAVLHPPNLTDPIQREKMMAVVQAFENTEYTLGRDGTIFFFLEYLNYLDEINAELENTERIWNTKLLSWLKYTGGSNQWATDIRFNENGTFQAFRFQIAMQNTVGANQHKNAAQKLREIADRQPFKIEIFHETFPFADQYIIIVPAIVRSIIISLICMATVAVILVPSLAPCRYEPPSGILIIVSIISINTGIFGYMTFWGVNLDAVSMISIIMSIGFAVDLSSHITYAFVTATGSSKERVTHALESLGWPIFQGAASTIAGVSVLYTVNAYIILTFFKTIWLTMVIGLLHGLLFIPITLSFFPLSSFSLSSKL